MEEKYTPYDQMRNSYSCDVPQGENVPVAQSTDRAPEAKESAEATERTASLADVFPSNPETDNPTGNRGLQSKHNVGKEEVILSLSQSLASALHYQQMLDEKLVGIMGWQEKQEKSLHDLIAQLGSLSARMDKLAGSFSATSSQSAPSQETALTLEEIHKALSRVEKSNLDAIRESKNFQQTLYAKQNKELDSYRSLHSNTANANMLTEIAHIRNAAQDIASRLDDRQAKNLRIGVVEAIDEFLEEYGVEIHQTPVGERRSLRTCQTRKQVPTDDETLHGMVACSVTPSFAIGTLILLKEIVDTYVYDPSLKTEADTEGESAPEEKSEVASPNEQPRPAKDQDIPRETTDVTSDCDNTQPNSPATETVAD